jgi:DNA ligase-1
MSGTKIMAAIKQIREESSKNGKIALLKRFLGEDFMFAEVMKLTYDPMITFGVTSKLIVDARATIGAGTREFGSNEIQLLEQLAERKLTGHAARDAILGHIQELNASSGMLLSYIIDKSVDGGFGESSLNKAVPNFIEVFKTMLAQPLNESKIEEFPVYVEEKFDGLRVVAIVRSGKPTQFFSRTGKPIATLDHIGELLSSLRGMTGADFVMDGEVVAGSFNDTVSSVRKKGKIAKDAVFKVFDAMPLSKFQGQKVVDMTIEDRMKLASALVGKLSSSKVVKVKSYKANSMKEIELIDSEIRARGGEGVVIKLKGSFYEKKRSYAWMKIKAEESEDLRIVGAFEGTGKYEGMLGGLIVDFKGVNVRVGGGFSDAQREEIWEALKEDAYAFGEIVIDDIEYSIDNEALNVLGRIVEVEYHETTPDGSLRHPRFVRFRDSITGEKE